MTLADTRAMKLDQFLRSIDRPTETQQRVLRMAQQIRDTKEASNG